MMTLKDYIDVTMTTVLLQSSANQFLFFLLLRVTKSVGKMG